MTFTPSLGSSNRPMSSCRKALPYSSSQDSENMPVGGATPSDDKVQDTIEGRVQHHQQHEDCLLVAMSEL